ncbi:anti-phage DNA glycosylase Brig1 [Plantactinospora sonchi]|uniref:Uncharacterized protein n=1 Tax=Plantactinospora sonchi TaxID=1544735 RepID=A0ABU7S2T1_9ACTN
MTSARVSIAAFWDAHTTTWLDGEDPLPEPLADWFDSYAGAGAGAVTRDGLAEPYHGDLLGKPRMVVLGLNPGRFQRKFQARDGLFAAEIRRYGSYREWAATFPYNRDPWTATMGPNRYYRARLRFTRNWLGDPKAAEPDLLIFECYPWHSTSLTAPLRPPREAIEKYVWQPIAELPVEQVFAFGKPWHDLAQALDLPLEAELGAGGSKYGSKVRSRAVRVYRLPSGQSLVVEWHSGSAGPPSAKETVLLRSALTGGAPTEVVAPDPESSVNGPEPESDATDGLST